MIGNRPFRTLCAVLVSTTMLASACGGAKESASNKNGGSGAEELLGDVTREDETADPSGTPPSGSLNIGVALDLSSLDPHRATVEHTYFLTPVYDTLTRIGTNGEALPLVATSWESNEAATQWTFQLDPKASFTDGTTLDADAVVWSIERGRSIVNSTSASVFDQIEAVRAVDPSTVEFVFEHPAGTFPTEMSSMAGMIINPEAGEKDLGRAPMGSGPFEFAPGKSLEGAEYHYAARDDYWGRGVGVEDITIKVLPDPSARSNAIKGGQVDIAADMPNIDLTSLSNDFDIVTSSDTSQLYMQIFDSEGTMVEALADPRVRQAMSLAIDRDGLNRALFDGGSIATTSFWVEGSPYFSAEVDGVGYDLAEAKRLLAEAGYPDGFSFTLPTIEPLRKIAEAVQGLLAKADIDMQIELQQVGTMAARVQEGKFPANLTAARGATPRSFFEERLASDTAYNPFDVDRSDLDELADAAVSAIGDDTNAKWAATYEQAINGGTLIVLVQAVTGSALADGVTGAQIVPGDAIPNLRNVRVDG